MPRFLINGASCCTGFDNPNLENWGEMLGMSTGAEIVNLSRDGASNSRILRTTREAISTQKFDAVMIVCPFILSRREFVLNGRDYHEYEIYDVTGSQQSLDRLTTNLQKKRVSSHYRNGNEMSDYYTGLSELHYLKLILEDYKRPYYLATDIRIGRPRSLGISEQLKSALCILEQSLKSNIKELCMFNFFPEEHLLPSGHPNAVAHGLFADHLIETFLKPSGVL